MAAKKSTNTIPVAKLALYEKLIATDPSIERKGATIPYTSANGKMFTYFHRPATCGCGSRPTSVWHS